MATIQVVLTDGTTAYASDVMDNFTEIFTNIDSSNVASTAKTGTGNFVLASGNPVITGNLCFGTTASYIYGDATHVYVYTNSTKIAQFDTGNFSVFGVDVTIDSTKSLYFDGGNDTRIRENSANQLGLWAGGVNSLVVEATQVSIQSANFIIPSTKKLFFDGSGSGDTYTYESSANVLDTYVGGSLVTSATSSAFDIDAGTLYVNTSANSVYIGSQTTSLVGSADCKLQVTSSGLNKAAFISTDSGSSAQSIYFYKNSSSPASSDGITNLQFYGNDSGGNATQYVSITCFIDDPSDGSENGYLRLQQQISGTNTTVFTTQSGNLNFSSGNIINTGGYFYVTTSNSTYGLRTAISTNTLTYAGFFSITGSGAAGNYGIYTTATNSSSGTCVGGDFNANSSSGTAYGINVSANSSSGTAYGVYITGTSDRAIHFASTPTYFLSFGGAIDTTVGAHTYYGRIPIRDSGGTTRYIRIDSN